MKPEGRSHNLLAQTRSKAKMIEYLVPENEHVQLTDEPAKLLTLSIGILGDLVANSNRAEISDSQLQDFRTSLLFSAQYFDAYLQSKLNSELDPYLILLGAAAYYLCDLPGGSKVLTDRLSNGCPELGGEGLEQLLHWILRGDLDTHFSGSRGAFGEWIDGISQTLVQFFRDGSEEQPLFELCANLTQQAHNIGTPTQLLLADTIAAVIRRKHHNSSWNSVPLYSGISRDEWSPALKKETFIRELWPAQHLLGIKGILQGRSAVVQMPTSAGKTKATELVIRAAFLSGRTKLAIVVAPFRALCHEIKNSLIYAFQREHINVDEISDALQPDFDLNNLLASKQVIVITPEKLVYVLRHAPEIAREVGLIVFDEGHQFDSGTRGITYELLVTALRDMLDANCQKILISAVVSNARAIGDWLNGAESEVVIGTHLIPTFRSIGFASWIDQRGRIDFVSQEDPETRDFFVPRVIEAFTLQKKGRERKERFFPDRSDGQTVALFLGLKLVPNGSVAIFCGRKDTAANMCEKLLDAFDRGLSMEPPAATSDENELGKLLRLHRTNLGDNCSATLSAALGIFSHHGNTPHGIRLAVEHAMRNNLVHYVICTSTLAQGVNLPIRYLIVTSIRQGQEKIKVRDFHNLMGRAGRAGMHTEGSVLFADPDIYGRWRKIADERWRWNEIKDLLEANNTEPCISDLLSIFEPIQSRDKKSHIVMKPLDFSDWYINKPDSLSTLAKRVTKQFGAKVYPQGDVEQQIARKLRLITAVESYLLSHLDPESEHSGEQEVIKLAEGTLAYFLAEDPVKRSLIVDLFKLLANHIKQSAPDPLRRKLYARTLYGMRDAKAIEEWTTNNLQALADCNSERDLLDLIWPLLAKHITKRTFVKCDKPDVLHTLTQEWIMGKPFFALFDHLMLGNARVIWGDERRDYKIDDVVDICEGGLGYDGALLIGSITEFVRFITSEDHHELVMRLDSLQKMLKYGLPTPASIHLYELGFSDRVLAQDLDASLDLIDQARKKVKSTLKMRIDEVMRVLDNYPSYFRERLEEFA